MSLKQLSLRESLLLILLQKLLIHVTHTTEIYYTCYLLFDDFYTDLDGFIRVKDDSNEEIQNGVDEERDEEV